MSCLGFGVSHETFSKRWAPNGCSRGGPDRSASDILATPGSELPRERWSGPFRLRSRCPRQSAQTC
eukprot:9487690-Pyramimonas_sp.AAC.2